MKKFFNLLLFILFTGSILADEGMWTISRLDGPLMQKMKKLGLQLPVNQIYDTLAPSLKDAIIVFDNAGSAEFVSANGLVMTNHHCARGRAQEVSTAEHNYLRDGFWANSLGEEIPIKGLTVRVLVRQIDVTDKALALLKTISSRKASYAMEKVYNDSTRGIEASLDGFSDGTYLLSVYQVFKDVRMVGLPPESIGNFGGETDNFAWPRHSADFSVFRVYADANNQPAAYSVNNQPFHPKKFIPVSLKGVQPNDFSMILGFPFSTARHTTSFEMIEEMDVKNRATGITKGAYIEVVEREMNKDERVRLLYSDKNFSAGNSCKLALGTLKQVYLSPALAQKQKSESEFRIWVQADTSRLRKYGDCLAKLERNYALEKEPKYAHALLTGALFGDATLFGIRSRGLVDQIEFKEKSALDKQVLSFRNWYVKFLTEYDSKTDQEIVRAMVKLLKKEMKKESLPDFYAIIDSQFKGNIDAYVNDLYAKSIFTSPDSVQNFMENPTKRVQQDPLYVFGISVYTKLMDLRKLSDKYSEEIRKYKKVFNEAMREKNANMLSYPDANFSLRLSYGTVCGASPRDGLTYRFQTTLKGVLEKEDSTSYDFQVHPKLKSLYVNKDFGRYASKEAMPVDFLTNNDICGGNSGSPVLNKKGELIGIAFDGNWESLASNSIFEPEKNRTVNVDIRYALFIIDKFASNKYILNELTIQ